jgi:hypothetical protein
LPDGFCFVVFGICLFKKAAFFDIAYKHSAFRIVDSADYHKHRFKKRGAFQFCLLFCQSFLLCLWYQFKYDRGVGGFFAFADNICRRILGSFKAEKRKMSRA